MMAFRFLILIALLVPGSAIAGDEENGTSSFFLPTPDGWRTETLPFLLSFAPELKHQGVEELRFAPGMFKADGDDFWSYAFIWWIVDDAVLEPDGLASDLEVYFAGLTKAVATERGVDASDATVDVHLERVASSGQPIELEGWAKTFDPFVTAAPISLGLRVRQIRCPVEERLAVIFELSPQQCNHVVWEQLAAIREGFQCRRQQP
jgi:hypothetical protein